ncbi:MAG: hypothetical protein HOQ37_16365 [Cupriavidus sp.]|nr:hypothetical protein [Cupriavidus sp.]
MGFSRSDANTSSTTTTTTNTDNRMVVDGGGVGVNGYGNVVNNSSTDLGAINASFDFAKTSTETSYKSTSDAIGLARDGLKLNLEQSSINAKGFLDSMGKLIDFARATTDTAKAVNETATQNVAAAYSNVQEISTGQKFMVAGALCIAGIVAINGMKKG